MWFDKLKEYIPEIRHTGDLFFLLVCLIIGMTIVFSWVDYILNL